MEGSSGKKPKSICASAMALKKEDLKENRQELIQKKSIVLQSCSQLCGISVSYMKHSRRAVHCHYSLTGSLHLFYKENTTLLNTGIVQIELATGLSSNTCGKKVLCG